jgi:hypothetical protein
MKQLFVETAVGKFPVTQLHWSSYTNTLELVTAETPYEREKDSMVFYFKVNKFGLDDMVNPDNTIDLFSVNNPDFKAKLVL